MDELYSTIYIDELFPSVNMDELYSTIHSGELFPSTHMDELYSTINIDELSHQSTWTSSTLLFILTSSPISQHGRALLNNSHWRALPSVNMDEIYSAIHNDELSHQSTWTSSTLLFTLTSSSHQSTRTSSTQLFILTSSSYQSTWTSSNPLFTLTSSSHQST